MDNDEYYQDFNEIQINNPNNNINNSNDLDLKLNLIIKLLEDNLSKMNEEILDIRCAMTNMETSITGLSEKLINQNIKLSDLLVPKTIEKKDMYYKIIDNSIYVYGPGTYTNKGILKENGEWDADSKSWKMNINVYKLLQLFPEIQNKSIKSNYMIKE